MMRRAFAVPACVAFARFHGTKMYTRTHEWVAIEGTTATIGVSKVAVEQLGKVVFVGAPLVGDEFQKDDEFADVESVKAASKVISPVDGTVVQVNDELEASPQLINESPEENGWIAKLTVKEGGVSAALLTDVEYAEFVKEE
jgi:glycine cleavage system H protein